MKTENTLIPNSYIIESIDLERNKCELIINTDIEEIEEIEGTEENEVKYVYQSYRAIVPYSSQLEEELQTDEGYEKYLNKLRNIEKNKIAENERNWRNEELEKTDKYMLKDFPNDYSEKTILDYRQALRDYPSQDNFPFGERPKIEDYI